MARRTKEEVIKDLYGISEDLKDAVRNLDNTIGNIDKGASLRDPIPASEYFTIEKELKQALNLIRSI